MERQRQSKREDADPELSRFVAEMDTLESELQRKRMELEQVVERIEQEKEKYLRWSMDREKQIDGIRDEFYLEERNLLLARMEDQKMTQEERERVENIRSQFINILSHELRTPLATSSGYVKMLLSDDFGPLAPEQREKLTTVAAGIGRLDHMIRQIMEALKIENGSVKVEPSDVDVTELLEGLASRVSDHLDSRGQHLCIDMEQPLPRITADPRKLESILANLLENASEYSPEEKEITLCCGRTGDDKVSFTVHDTGKGIAPSQLGSAMDQFTTLEDPLRRADAHLGLGLFIAGGYARAHGGRLKLESDGETGTTATLILPVRGPTGK